MKSLSEIFALCEAQTGINPSVLYCIVTGKPYGRIDFDSLCDVDFMLDTAHGTLDDESRMDEFLVRTCLTMRPSPAWQSISPERLDSLRLRQPRELLAYLLNRLYMPQEQINGLRITQSTRIVNARARITLWKIISTAQISDLQLNQLLMVLLDLDTKFNLHTLAPIKQLPHFFTCASIGVYNDLIQLLVDWNHALTQKKLAAERTAQLSADFWSKGSSLTRVATVKQYFATVTPAPSTIAKREKAKTVNMATQMLEDLMDTMHIESAQRDERQGLSAEVIAQMKKPKEARPALVPAKPKFSLRLNFITKGAAA